MIKRIRIVPTLLIMLVTCILLFGGWSLYERYFVKQPVERVFKQHPEITSYDVNWQANTLQVRIKSKKGTSIRELTTQLTVSLEKQTNGKKVQIEYMNDESTPEIDSLWSRASFDVSEAIVHQKFSVIPVRLKKLQQQNSGIQVHMEMDSRYVYIQLTDKKGNKTVLLPLQASSIMGSYEKSTTIHHE